MNTIEHTKHSWCWAYALGLILVCSGPGVSATALPHTALQANLGPVPISYYLSLNYDTTYSHGYVPYCSTSHTVQWCYQQILSSFHSQGVKAVRFMFYFCGGGYSMALNGCGTYNGTSLNSTWATNMAAFLRDVAAAGITQIVPTPQYVGAGDSNVQYCTDSPTDVSCPVCVDQGNCNWFGPPHGTSREPSLNDGVLFANVPDACTNGTVNLFFWPAAPFGVRGNNTLHDPAGPWRGGFNNSYNCSPKNPYFVGWNNIYSVIASMLSSARSAGLSIHEFDITNEIDVVDYTVSLRFMSDNKHNDTGSGNMMDNINYYLNYYGLGTSNVTWSVGESQASSNLYDCLSVYGDSARILSLDAMLAAAYGAPVGLPSGAQSNNGLTCGGAVAGDWVAQPRSYPMPTLVDNHSYNKNSAGDASITFNGIKAFLDAWGPAGGYWHGNIPALYNAEVMIGETHGGYTNANSGKSCEDNPNPSQLVGYEINGFNSSNLANGRTTVFRPWINFINYSVTDVNSGCYPVPATVNPPYATTP